MQEESAEEVRHIPWPDTLSNSYRTIATDEATPDLLTTNSPPQSPLYGNLHQEQNHHHHQHQHHHQQQQQQQQQHAYNINQFQTSPTGTYATHSLAQYSGTTIDVNVRSFEYENNNNMPDVIPKQSSTMRTDNGDEEIVDVEGSMRRGWKRKQGEKSESIGLENKTDVSQRCDVCGEEANGHYFGALVCLPCKSFFIRCTKDGRPSFNNQCGGKCDVLKGGRVRCQHCRFQKCINVGMYRKEKPEAVEPAEGQILCKVCGDIANGVHFGVTTCEGCKKFFRRGLKESKTYNCKGSMHCSINPRMRNNCRYCRYQKCLYEGMSREAIKMGRPKKGEIAYRKPVKKNGIHLMKGFYDKTISETRHVSLSSDLDQEEDVMSPCDNVFSSLSSLQQHLMTTDNQQMNHQMQPVPRYLGDQQSSTFSLGSILHDCMTVQDWDHKVEMVHSDHDLSTSHSAIMTSNSSSSRNNQSMMGETTRSSHNISHLSPTTLSDPLSSQFQQNLQHHHHLQQPQITKRFEQLKNSHQQNHQTAVYHEHAPTSNISSAIIEDVNFSNKQTFIANRKIKEEDIQINTTTGNVYNEDVLLADMKNLQTFSKSDFHSYPLQGLNLNTQYGRSDENKVCTSSNGNTCMPASSIESHGSPQIVAVNIPPGDVVFTPQSQHGYILNGSTSYHHGSLTQQQQRHVQSNVDSNPGQNPPTVDQLLISGVLSSNGNNQSSRNQGTRIGAHLNHNFVQSNSNITHILDKSIQSSWASLPTCGNGIIGDPRHAQTARSHAYISDSSDLYENTQQFVSENTTVPVDNACSLVHRSAMSRNNNNDNGSGNNFAVLSFGGHPRTSEAGPLLNFTDKLLNIHNKFSESRSLRNDAQQKMSTVHTRHMHLSSDDVEELLNSVSSQQPRIQGVLLNEHLILSERRVDCDQDIVDLRRQPLYNFVVKDEKPEEEELNHCNRRRTSASSDYQGSVQTQQYHQGNSPLSQDICETNKRQYHCQMSLSSQSSLDDRHEVTGRYINNNNSNINNNNNNHIIHCMYQDTFNSRTNQTDHFEDNYEDSFNSALILDSTLLHEINRIFLGIDNSCDTYGCDHQICEPAANNKQDGSVFSCMSPDDFCPEISHRYWHGLTPSCKFLHLTPERLKMIQDVLDAFDDLQKTYVTNDPENLNKKLYLDQLEHWHHIQRKIARHVVAGQRFCRNIPGYFKLDIQDRISLGKHVGFGLMVLVACTEFYDPEFKRFKHIWNWTMPMQNPLFSYKVHLLSLGDRIHDLDLDRAEASLICAISMTSIDCPNLLNNDIVCVVRDALIDALKAHICTKPGPAARFKKLMSIMPQVRLMTVWYNNLMKKMSVPSEISSGKIARPRLVEEDETENT